jgi:L-ascorbate metabolism protein UlaG (beta-lactamase superfamily)
MRKVTQIASAALVAMTMAACTSASATPSAAPASAGPSAGPSLTVYYEESAQVELVAPSGERVFFDVTDPTLISAAPTAKDILLTTHLHSDHYNQAWADAFPGQQVTNKAGEFTFGTTKVKSLDAAHDDNPILPGEATNHIFVVEFAGFKVVQLGSTGQLALTADQLAAIGSDVDLVIGPLQNVGGGDPTNSKPIDVINQIKPKLVVPSHTGLEYVQAAGKQWDALWSGKKSVTIPLAELPTRTTLLCMGSLGPSYGKILKAPEAKW